jgi:hypothetical protein
MEVKIACKVCGKVLDNEKDLMTHFLTEHREIGLYGTPVFVGELPIPMRKAAFVAAPKPKKKPKRVEDPLGLEQAEEDLEGYEELSLDGEEDD